MPFCTCGPSSTNPASSNLSLVRTNSTISHQPDRTDCSEFKTEVFEFHDPRRLIELANDGKCCVSSVVVDALGVVMHGWTDEASWIIIKKPMGRPHEITVVGGSLDLSIRLFVPHDVPAIQGFSRLQSDEVDVATAVASADDSADDPSYKLIRSWLDRCLNKHGTTCGKLITNQEMPKRLIDTQRKNTSNDDVRLEETNGKQRKYLALSHCWGGPQTPPPIKLCKRSLASMKKRIPWSTIPKNFQDAITLTRNLGIRWIWIDTLCIIQDEASDWERESLKMGNIYEGSYFTIVAAISPNCHEPFLLPRRSGKPVPNSSSRVWVRKQHIHEDLKGAPLSSRGWAYQERLLSTRKVIFGREELYWECKSEQLCECGSLDREVQVKPLKRRWKPGASFNWHSVERYDYWHETIAAYTKCDLTQEKDTLPALSGIAKRIYLTIPSINTLSKESDVYLAGLWKDRLIRDLCWQQDDDPGRKLPKSYLAPSWSWASVRANIINQCDEAKFRIIAPRTLRVLSASCTPVGENPYGEVNAGHLVVSAPTITVKLESECKSPSKGMENGFSVIMSGTSPTNPSSLYFWPDAYLNVSSPILGGTTIQRCDKEIQKPVWKNLNVPLRCVLVVQGESVSEGVNMKMGSRCIWALVLGKAMGKGEVWERLGILTSFRKDGDEIWGHGYKWFDKAPVESTKII